MSDPTEQPAPTGPYATAAATYWQSGWKGCLPVPYGRKTPVPTGYTGTNGAWPSYPDVHAWTEQRGADNIALRLPPDVLGIDVDQYDAKPGGLVLADLEQRLGTLPATWRTTSRDDGISGIRLYRIPAGLRWPGVLGPGIETIRHEHRYALAWPSAHPKGGTYRWITPSGAVAINTVPAIDELPNLPATWVEHFTKGETATDQPRAELSLAASSAWLIERGAGLACRHMQTALDKGLADLTTGTSRHDAALSLTNRLVWIAGEGHTGARDALRVAERAFVAAVGSERGEPVASSEFARMVNGAMRIAAAAHPQPSPDPCLDPFGALIIKENPWTSPQTPCPTSALPASKPGTSMSSTTPTFGFRESAPISAPVGTSGPADGATGAPDTTSSTEASTELPDELPASWARADLTRYLDGTYEPVVPSLMPRADGVCLVYPGLTHSFHGESESGKSMVAQIECVRLLADEQPVLYVDFESDAAAITERLLLLGATPAQVLNFFDYRRPEISPTATPGEMSAWADMLGRRYALAIIDGVTDSLGTFGLSTKDNDEIAKWSRMLPRQIADRTGAAVVVIDHVTKDTESRGRFAIGGQAKLNGLTGAAYTVEISEPLGRGLRGVVILRCAKDRPGYVRGNSAPMLKDRTQESARVIIDSTGDHIVVTVEAPHGDATVPRGSRAPFRLTGVMERISRALEAADEPLSGAALEQLVGGNRDRVRAGCMTLLTEGYVTVSEGKRNAVLHSLVRTYRQRLDPQSDLFDAVQAAIVSDQITTSPDLARPRPDLAPGEVQTTSPARPHIPKGWGRGGASVGGSQNGPTSPESWKRAVVAGDNVEINQTTGEVREIGAST